MYSTSPSVKGRFSDFTSQGVESVFSQIRFFPEYFDLTEVKPDRCSLLLSIKQRVEELMKMAVPIGFPPTKAMTVLSQPYKFLRLMESLHFVNLNSYDLISRDETFALEEEVADYIKQTRVFNYALLIQGEQHGLPGIDSLRIQCEKVPAVQHPLPLRPVLIQDVKQCALSTEIRGLFFKKVAQSCSVSEEDFFDLEGRDARRLFRRASSFPEYFNALPSEGEALKTYESKKETVRTLCQRVEELMKRASFPSEASPEEVLRTPYRFLRLMHSLYFADAAPERFEAIMKYAGHASTSNQIELAEAMHSCPEKAKVLRSLQEQIATLFHKLSHSPAPREETGPLLKKLVGLCTASIEERGRLRPAQRPGEPLFHFERKQLEESLSYARKAPEFFLSVLPENNVLYHILDKETVRVVSCELEDQVAKYMEETKPLGFPKTPSREALINPWRFSRLIESLRFINYEEERGKVLQYANKSQSLNHGLLQLTERLSFRSGRLSLFPANRKLSLLLASASSAPVLELIGLSLASIEIRLELYLDVRNALMKRLASLESFFDGPPRMARPEILATSPELPKEADWIRAATDSLDMIEPLLMIISEVESFLRSYLNGTITEASENKSRDEILSWLSKKLREKFPKSSLPSDEVAAIALTTYLRAGFIRFHLERKEFSTYFKEREQQNREESFILGLMHALPIDFQSACLTPEEIRVLAESFLNNPEAPVSAGWISSRRAAPTEHHTQEGSS